MSFQNTLDTSKLIIHVDLTTNTYNTKAKIKVCLPTIGTEMYVTMTI